MPTATYIALANTTLSTSAGSVTFSSIPATYRDLVVVLGDIRRTSAGAATINVGLRFNSDTGTNYPYVRMKGSSGGVISQAFSIAGSMFDVIGGGVDTDVRSMSIINIMDYSATDKHKTGLTRYNLNANDTTANAFRWANTNAITSITLLTLDTNAGTASSAFAAGSTFALYGIVS
jgi:hypothetical protein